MPTFLLHILQKHNPMVIPVNFIKPVPHLGKPIPVDACDSHPK